MRGGSGTKKITLYATPLLNYFSVGSIYLMRRVTGPVTRTGSSRGPWSPKGLPHRSVPAVFPHTPLQWPVGRTASELMRLYGMYSLGRRMGWVLKMDWYLSQVTLLL